MELDDLLKEMETEMLADFSDSYLAEKGFETRADIGIGEYVFGITMMPCDWVYNYLLDYKRVLKENEILKKEKEQAWEEWNNLEQGSYETEQKLKQQIKESQRENEELKLDLHEMTISNEHKKKEWAHKAVLNSYILKQKMENKIKELNRKIDESIDNSKGALDEEFIEKAGELLAQKRILQELLDETEKSK